MMRKELWVEYMRIIKELDYPPAFLADHEHFAMLEGEEKKSENMVNDLTWGIASPEQGVFVVHPWIEGKERSNVIYHEIAHILWPWRQHWWIEMFAEIMARGGGRGHYSKLYNKSKKDMPSRSKLLKMARRQSNKMKHKITNPSS